MGDGVKGLQRRDKLPPKTVIYCGATMLAGKVAEEVRMRTLKMWSKILTAQAAIAYIPRDVGAHGRRDGSSKVPRAIPEHAQPVRENCR